MRVQAPRRRHPLPARIDLPRSMPRSTTAVASRFSRFDMAYALHPAIHLIRDKHWAHV